MRNRADEIRKRHEARLKGTASVKKADRQAVLADGGHPLFKGHLFLMQVMGAVCLFLLAGILFKYEGAAAVKGQQYIKEAFRQEFQFAAVKNWYEDQFGKPLALLPGGLDEKPLNKEAASQKPYAIPAAGGKVFQSFKSNGEGLIISTGEGQEVETVSEGYVIFAGKKDKTGYTVVIQHENEEESWYGMLEKIDSSIKLYDYIEQGAVLGRVSQNREESTGKFYFALKKGEQFIDPSKVIRFD
ncbi:peptidoglycan DD-metalloendopeptidase family protein [Fictibacillus iocasae]|uniref:Peptidoglycan DD-metalloendopeptidase family protein n=1 Tax=Fictibacillus iocasae TaxID=2715437 RepID=A0ABW2NP18_9BACL